MGSVISIKTTEEMKKINNINNSNAMKASKYSVEEARKTDIKNLPNKIHGKGNKLKQKIKDAFEKVFGKEENTLSKQQENDGYGRG